MKKIIHIISTLTLIGVVIGAILSFVNNWATPLIELNKKKETEKAVYLVNPLGKKNEKVKANGEIFKVFDEADNLLGYSFVCEGNGFQGKIRIMVGVDKNLEKIISYEVLEQSETPGLGTKILDDPFKKQFNNLFAIPRIEWIKGKAPSKPNEVQTITGATISSVALVNIINSGLENMRKLKEKNLL
ncbi:MAG: FMN-binding protein [Melioribacteraceae bacterium]|nr:FMN-binding protein [Melioribacteraceae bacterium]